MSVMAIPGTAALFAWLEAHAVNLDSEADLAAELLPRLAAASLPGVGVAEALGGVGGDVTDGVKAIAAVSERSLAAGFVLWGHRTYIEYLLQSPNAALRERLLPDLLAGRMAGATGLSNAMKFLSGLAELQVCARTQGDRLTLDGKLPWVTNLRPQGFHVAVAAARENGEGALVVSLSHEDPGLLRSADLDLMALRASNTAAVALSDAKIGAERIIHPDAGAWLPMVRPAFLGLQCGMAIGLVRRALAEARLCLGTKRERNALAAPLGALGAMLAEQEGALLDGLRTGAFEGRPSALFRIRIALADILGHAVGLELQATGGRAYLRSHGADFSRRWREAAFIPIVTPSVLQLKEVLAAEQPA
ncbi:MAG TPA: acyl-CoA dehydrogenase family protein [Acidocella sp.]|jgi:alkylation response protein AidB-like acyl-CoA dehydrogenase|uniref:acyl-CoA dehydrogenase family protein n=1 Tax=Acidocella sp. TaxID=50710 RepID=UPI002BE3FCD6|nr:acyl-CoA dehydrogenase family protein [Acidocella sp.]HVE21886.1 acyl-CoA dehydrogenase family protein [Acidocella sp.]